MKTRRAFLRQGLLIAAGAVSCSPLPLHSSPMGQPFGFQTFEIIPDLSKDWHGTWNKMASYGYRYADLVEFSPQYARAIADKTPEDVLNALHSAGLDATNGHFSYEGWFGDYGGTLKKARTLKLQSVICQLKRGASSADDYKKMADDLNVLGRKLKNDGFLLGYHNHQIEFVPVEDEQVPWDILLSNTDPALVSYQIDVGNLAFGGGDPVVYLQKYPGRYFSLHVKDYRKGVASVPVGQGDLPWQKLFAIARQQNIHSYVAEVGAYGIRSLEGEPLQPAREPVLESFRESAEFLKAVK